MGRLAGKVAIITGAGGGIGAAAARLFAAEGATVVAADLHEDEAILVAAAIAASGHMAVGRHVDVRDSVSVERLVLDTVAEHGRLDIMYCSAGVLVAGRAHEMPLDVWQRHLDVNLTGSFLCAKHSVPAMIDSGGGVILLTGSTVSHVGEHNDVAYVASKGGVLALTKALALDYARDHIRVNAICPGWIDTAFNGPLIDDDAAHTALVEAVVPMGRQGTVDEVAAAALFLVSDDASYMTGSSLMVDAGFVAR